MEPMAVVARDQHVLVDDERPRTDEAHLATPHVQQLRELVEARVTQHPPYARHAGIVLDLEQPARLVEVAEPVLLGVRIYGHGAELQHLELPPVAAHSRLAEEHGPAAV